MLVYSHQPKRVVSFKIVSGTHGVQAAFSTQCQEMILVLVDIGEGILGVSCEVCGSLWQSQLCGSASAWENYTITFSNSSGRTKTQKFKPLQFHFTH